MDSEKQPVIENVLAQYKKKAEYHGDENAVLDGSSTPAVVHTNIMLSYLTRRFMMDYLRPQKKEVILDYGCGVGRMTFVVAPYVSKIYGVDITPQLIDIAKRKLADKSLSNVELQLLDPHSFRLPDIRFDKIFLIGTIMHISDEMLDKILPQFYNQLNNGGKIILFEHLKKTETMYIENATIFRSINHLKEIFEKNGFKTEFVKPVLRMPSYSFHLWKKVNAFFTFLLPLFYQLEKLTVNRKPQFVDYHYYITIFSKK